MLSKKSLVLKTDSDLLRLELRQRKHAFSKHFFENIATKRL